MAKNIPQLFNVINQLLIKLDPSRLDGGSRFGNTLRQHFATVDNNGRLMFTNSQLERATKRASDIQSNASKTHLKCKGLALNLIGGLYCEKVEPASELCQTMTMHLKQRHNECAW